MSLKILLADDSPAAARAVQAALPSPEFEVRVADDGDKAVRALDEFGPDAVLAALALSVRNGYELAAVLRERTERKAMALVLLQGAVEPLDVGRLAGLDHDGVVRKPFESRALARLVRQAVERRREIPSLPEEPFLQPPAAPADAAEPAAEGPGLAGSPLEKTLRAIVREELGHPGWEAKMREIASAEFKKRLVEELRAADSSKK